MYMLYYRPFNSRSMLIFEVFNEGTLLTISYLLVVYCGILEIDELRYEVGWYIVVASLFNILVNWLNLVITMIISLCKKLQEKMNQRRKAKKEAADKGNRYKFYNSQSAFYTQVNDKREQGNQQID